MQRAPKRALKVLRCAGDCKRLWAIVRLIQRPHDDNVLGSAALREVSAAERFRRVLDGSVVLFDSDLRLQYTLKILPLHWHYLLTALLICPGIQFLKDLGFDQVLANAVS